MKLKTLLKKSKPMLKTEKKKPTLKPKPRPRKKKKLPYWLPPFPMKKIWRLPLEKLMLFLMLAMPLFTKKIS